MDQNRNRKQIKGETVDKMENLISIESQNPFLNTLVVEKILDFCMGYSQGNKFFPSLRLVCKVWDAECSKILRKDTQIPIPRLLEPYPNGLGWTGNRSYSTTGMRYHYNCPFPTTREFENFQITITCESAKDRKVQRWFCVSGEQVKSLQFTCALTCYHQNDFLLNVLHKWCPNLETLRLDGVQCFQSLLYMFEGKLDVFPSYKNCEITCKNLKNVTISVEAAGTYKDCKCKVGQLPSVLYNDNIEILKKLLDDLRALINVLPEKDLSVRPEISSFFYQLIETGDVGNFSKIVETYSKMDGVDWGVLGHILRTAPIEKLVIKQLVNITQTQDLLIFLLCQPNKLGSTLQHFEFQDASLCVFSLKIFTLLKYSLSTLIMDKMIWRPDSVNYLLTILTNSAQTLVNFEAGVEILIYEARNQRFLKHLLFPHLPKLKSFTNNTLGLLHMTGLDLLRNAPNLEKCCIKNLRCDGSNALQKHVTGMGLHKFCRNLDDPSVKDHPLEHLKIQLAIESCHVDLLRRGLENLISVDFIILDPLELLLKYSTNDGWKKLEAVKLEIENAADLNEVGHIGNENIVKCFKKFELLKYFELTFHPDGMGYIPVCTFKNGFATIRNLRSLKINNLRILSEEKEEIDRSVEAIPFVSFPEATVFSRRELLRGITGKKVKLVTQCSK